MLRIFQNIQPRCQSEADTFNHAAIPAPQKSEQTFLGTGRTIIKVVNRHKSRLTLQLSTFGDTQSKKKNHHNNRGRYCELPCYQAYERDNVGRGHDSCWYHNFFFFINIAIGCVFFSPITKNNWSIVSFVNKSSMKTSDRFSWVEGSKLNTPVHFIFFILAPCNCQKKKEYKTSRIDNDATERILIKLHWKETLSGLIWVVFCLLNLLWVTMHHSISRSITMNNSLFILPNTFN